MKGKSVLGTLVAGSFAIFIILLLPLSQAWAAETAVLKAGPDRPGAHGEALIRNGDSAQKEVVVTAQGIRSNEVYTVWLVNMKPKMDMAGLGTGDFAFTSDASGNGHYTATVSGEELGRWQLIEGAHHSDRNPRKLKKMGIALKGQLNQAKPQDPAKRGAVDESATAARFVSNATG